MTTKMAERLRKAYAEKGLSAPEPPLAQRRLRLPRHPAPSTKKNQKTLKESVSRRITAHDRPPEAQKQRQEAPAPASPPEQTFVVDLSSTRPITLKDTSQITLSTYEHTRSNITGNFFTQGINTQCCPDLYEDEREIALGLDFGTSSIKVVIGDPALTKAFAVPFQDASDTDQYLLPCRLYESTDGDFSLDNGVHTHRDLKLALIADPDDPIIRMRASALLALVIRHARGWLFHEHADVYARTRLYWKLSLGLPVAHHLDNRLTQAFNDVAHDAWLAASAPGRISKEALCNAQMRREKIQQDPSSMSLDEDVEIGLVPEIAAQIYGFVNSSRFNPSERNIYLMVDVGAGSVDSSLFHVRPARGGRWDFEFFTSVVEPHGVMNLHRHRINWWQRKLNDCNDPTAKKLAQDFERYKFPTDMMVPLPDSFQQYISDVTVTLADSDDEPDQKFFTKKVLRQVRGSSYWRAWRDGYLDQDQLTAVPAFYCGGGMRMPFYGQLRKEMMNMPGVTWLKALSRRVELPRNLEAPGLRRENFDRLTVAFGLSFLEVNKLTKAIPLPRLRVEPATSWKDNYISKDAV